MDRLEKEYYTLLEAEEQKDVKHKGGTAAQGMVDRGMPIMVGVSPSMVGVVPSMVGVLPSMVGVVPGMVGVVPSLVGSAPTRRRITTSNRAAQIKRLRERRPALRAAPRTTHTPAYPH